MGTSLYCTTNARDNSSSKSSISSSETFTKRSRQENVAEPCTQIVDRGYQTLSSCIWLVKSFDEARINIYTAKDSNIITDEGMVSQLHMNFILCFK